MLFTAICKCGCDTYFSAGILHAVALAEAHGHKGLGISAVALTVVEHVFNSAVKKLSVIAIGVIIDITVSDRIGLTCDEPDVDGLILFNTRGGADNYRRYRKDNSEEG